MKHRKLFIIMTIFIQFTYTQDVTGGGLVDDGGWTTGGVTDGGITDGGLTDGGGFMPGCMDEFAYNYNPQANVDNYTCIYTDCEAFNSSIFIEQYPIYSCYMEAQFGGASCEDLLNSGDCSLVIECGLCESDACNDNQWECSNGDCIPISFYCDGSSDNGNASWGPDCDDGSDENFENCCELGLYEESICDPCEDVDQDEICDDEDECVGEYDECGVCNGNGIENGTCDCNGNILDDCGICGGEGEDTDGDGLCEDDDECPFDYDNDIDGDGICGNVDNCPDVYNVNQYDANQDGIGNACTDDNDGDGVSDDNDCAPNNANIAYDLGCGCGEEAPSGCDDNCGSTLEFDECGICGGNGPNVECWDGNVVCDASNCEEEPIEFDIELSMLYPLDNSHITDYNNLDIRWEYDGSNTESVYISVLFSYNYGGGLKTIADNVPLTDDSIVVDLSQDSNGEPLCDADDELCIETIYGRILIIASDGTDNDESEANSLIIGNPEGDININWINEDNGSVVIDWAWLNNQDIIIHQDIVSSLSNFNYLHIADDNGIHTDVCPTDNQTDSGFVVLESIRLNDIQETLTYTLDCGFDYCYEDGQRIIGYQYGNPIKFYASYEPELSNNDSYQLYPITDNNDEAIFNNDVVTILDFELGALFSQSITTSLIEDRDFDGFSVYNKINSTNIRDCEPILGCTDASAINFSFNANKLDCSCYYNSNDGCMDPTALNYNPTATVDSNNICLYGTCIVGCMDDTACNYDINNIVNDGCLYGNDCMLGCTDPAACNYDGPLANGWIEDGSCVYTVNDATNLNNGWCPLDTLFNVTQNAYYDRIPSMQQNSNLKYRVWLLDDLQNEILKTFESSGLNITVCEEIDCNGDFGGNAYIDDCGECITEDNLCADCIIADNLGDITQDGSVNVADIVVIMNLILTEAILSPEDLCIVDINGDGVLNVVDIIQLVNIVLSP